VPFSSPGAARGFDRLTGLNLVQWGDALSESSCPETLHTVNQAGARNDGTSERQTWQVGENRALGRGHVRALRPPVLSEAVHWQGWERLGVRGNFFSWHSLTATT